MSPIIHCDRITKIEDQIAVFSSRYGRIENSVKLLAVSKTRTASEIQSALSCGLLAFGENYAQEMHEKASTLGQMVADWHFIGPIQSNKTRLICEHASWVHSVERLKIARRLNQHSQTRPTKLNVCLQVNIDAEASKSGIAIDQLSELADQTAELDQLNLRGLMVVPAIRHTFDEQRRVFARCRELMQSLNNSGHQMDTLSMGMSADYEAAIAEGATIIRIGTALFGQRPK